jgi:hypothetical protein
MKRRKQRSGLGQYSELDPGRCEKCGSYFFHRLSCPVLVEGTIASLLGLGLLWVIMIVYWNISGVGEDEVMKIGVVTFIILTFDISVFIARWKS